MHSVFSSPHADNRKTGDSINLYLNSLGFEFNFPQARNSTSRPTTTVYQIKPSLLKQK